MKCPNCKKEIKLKLKLCPYCGTPISNKKLGNRKSQTRAKQPEPEQQTSKKRRQKKKYITLPKPIDEIRKIFFDTETSGLDCNNCKIIELAMLVVEDEKVVEEYDEFINIGESISPKITNLTGITNKILNTKGIDEKNIAKDLKDRLIPGTLMIAHNCQFHLSFIYSLLKRHYGDEADKIVKDIYWLDTVTILRDRKGFPHKLTDAVEYYALKEINFSRAIGHSKAVYGVYNAMKDERDDFEEYVNIFGYNPNYKVNGVIFPFIKYKRHHFNDSMVLPSNILPRK